MIQQTMERIHDRFKGIEICTIFPEEKDLQFFNKMRKGMVKMLVGNRDGITIIGPASVVKEIRRDPNKIQLFTITPRLGKNGSRNGGKRKAARRAVKRRR